MHYSVPMTKNRNRRVQASKSENRGWMAARLQHSNMNLTVPAGKGAGSYKRKPKHAKKGWDQ